MLRLATFVFVTIAAMNTAFGADQIVVPHAKRHARVMLPPGLPRPHYKYQETIVHRPAPPPVVAVEPDAEALISASVPTTPLLPGSSTLPGYYGRAFDYGYQGPYYGGGPYPSYFFRLPYACGVYGYC
jgi:hypothetical protein